MATEKEKMLAGELYDSTDPQLVAERRHARDLTRAFNNTAASDDVQRKQILTELLGALGKHVMIEPPFYCDYGYNIHLGDNVFFNFNCIVLDVMRVKIGSNTMFGPNVQIYTATHPLDAAERRKGLEFAQAIEIGCDVWIGGSVVIAPGGSIGDRSVIGAGSVVVKDIPADVFAAGNPCKVIRYLQTPTDLPGECNAG
ncbi:MAG: sugar O-acetyltransferase [Bellilinea sp.]